MGDTRQWEPNFCPNNEESEAGRFIFKIIEGRSKAYGIKHFDSTSLLQYQHKWELEQKKVDNTKVPKVDKINWAKTMENIVLHLQLIRGVREALLAYVVWCLIRVPCISPGHDAHLTLNKKMGTRAPIVDESRIPEQSQS